jgi:PAS domain S-box-containing protein
MTTGGAGTAAEVLAHLVAGVPVGIAVLDVDGRCVLVNDALARLGDVAAADAVGRDLGDCVPGLADHLEAARHDVLATGTETTITWEDALPSSGRRRWWQVTVRPIELGDEQAISVVVEDVTSSEDAAAELSTAERELRSVFARLDQGICICEMVVDDHGRGVDYRFVEVNEQFEDMTGLHDAAGRTARELVPDLETHWFDTYSRVALGGETIRFEQGSEAMGRYFDVFATPLATPRRFAIVFRDETARRAAEAAEAELAAIYRSMADELPLTVWLHGPDGARLFVNETFCDFFGVGRSVVLGTDWDIPVHPDDADAYRRSMERAIADRSDVHATFRVRDRDGSWRWLESWGRARFDRDGTFLGHLGTSADVTDRVTAQRALADSMGFLRRVLDSLFSFVGVLEPDGTLIEANRSPLAAAGLTIDDVRGKKFWDCYWWDYDDTVRRDLQLAVQRAAAGVEVRYDVPVRVADDERLWIDFPLVPLRGADGTITHLVPSGLDISDRIAAEHERAQLLAQEQERRHRAEVLETHAASLASAAHPREVAAVTASHIEQDLAVAFAVVDLRRGAGVDVVTSGLQRTDGVRFDPLAADDDLPGPVAIATNEAVRCSTSEEIVQRFPRLAGAVERDAIRSLVALPLRAANRRALGALVVASGDDDAFGVDTLSLLHGFAEQTGLALERSLLHERVLEVHEREHQIAVRLQRALLPDRLIEHPGVSIAAVYRAAGVQMEVGGDWYDSFQWPSGEIGIMVGDVVGHDLEAAAVMGRLRAALAALIPSLAPDPNAALEALHRLAFDRSETPFVTAAFAVIEPATGLLRASSAGHPPPLLIGRSGCEWLTTEPAPPLGLLEVAFPPPVVTQLHPGDRVLLYSDGLVERRGESIDDGLERLRSTAQHRRDHSPERFLDSLVVDLAQADADDDVVVMVMQWGSTD